VLFLGLGVKVGSAQGDSSLQVAAAVESSRKVDRIRAACHALPFALTLPLLHSIQVRAARESNAAVPFRGAAAAMNVAPSASRRVLLRKMSGCSDGHPSPQLCFRDRIRHTDSLTSASIGAPIAPLSRKWCSAAPGFTPCLALRAFIGKIGACSKAQFSINAATNKESRRFICEPIPSFRSRPIFIMHVADLRSPQPVCSTRSSCSASDTYMLCPPAEQRAGCDGMVSGHRDSTEQRPSHLSKL